MPKKCAREAKELDKAAAYCDQGKLRSTSGPKHSSQCVSNQRELCWAVYDNNGPRCALFILAMTILLLC